MKTKSKRQSAEDFTNLSQLKFTLVATFAATASAGLRGCVPVRWHKCLNACANA